LGLLSCRLDLGYWLSGGALGGWGAAQLNPARQYDTQRPSAHVLVITKNTNLMPHCLLPSGYRVDGAFLPKSWNSPWTVPVGAVAVSSPPPSPTVEFDRSSWLAAKLDPQVASPGPDRHRRGPVPTLRCDHCRGELGFGVQRYWHMQFCSSTCMAGYQQRLAPETKVKICRLDVPSGDQISGSNLPQSCVSWPALWGFDFHPIF
jgi:hypothetical protein